MGKLKKNNEFIIGPRSRRRGGGLVTCFGFPVERFLLSSKTWSARSSRLGLRTYEAKSDVAALDYNSRLRRDIPFLSSYSDPDFEGEFPVKLIGLCSDLLCFKPKVRNRTVTRHTKVRKVHQIAYRPELCLDSESELRNVLTLHNREL